MLGQSTNVPHKARSSSDVSAFGADLESKGPDELMFEARLRVREVKDFYTNALIYGVVSVLSILVWLSMGAGVFWPIWVIIAGGLSVGLKALVLGKLPLLEEFFPFLSNDWEAQQVENAVRSVGFQKDSEKTVSD